MNSTEVVPQDKNVGFAVLNSAMILPDLLAIVTDHSIVNYAQLGELVRSFASKMQQLGVRRGSVVALDSDDILIVIPVFFATALLGARWIAFKNYRVLSDFVQPTHWLRAADARSPSDFSFVLIDDSWSRTVADSTTFPGSEDLEAPFIYASTSGTTGTPKLLPISQRVLFDRGIAAADDFVERQTVFCSLFPPTANPYIARFVAALQNGATILHSRNFQMWYACGLNHLYGSVAQVSELLGKLVLPRKLPLIHVSGSRAGDGLARHLLSSFDQVIDLYASTETSRTFKNVKYLDKEGRLHTRGQALDSDVEIVDDTGHSLPAGEIGFVRVRNSYFASGYMNAPEAQARAFRDGWFYSGDFGMWGTEGDLQILGRTGDVINRGGIKVNALAIDEILRGIAGVKDAMCFENPVDDGSNELLAFVVYDPNWKVPEVLENIRKICVSHLGRTRTPNRVIPVDSVPRAHDGGAQRFRCKKIYQGLVSQQHKRSRTSQIKGRS